jgi:oligo-1,6-glucosidase
MMRKWWKESVVYQIYPRSFLDTTGNGIGDLKGIQGKILYLKNLGVDIVWICPVYESPNDDNGYDISNYVKIMDEFGGDQAFDELLEALHSNGIKLMMDVVLNHSSDEHHWFKESRKSKSNKYRDYYFWKEGKEGGPPNNWTSFFGGSTWKYDELTKEYYLHLFTEKQPDLNWENPKVRKEIHDVLHFWLEKGIDGFRMDVISLISKQLDFPDADSNSYTEIITKYYSNGPRIHGFLNELNRNLLCNYDVVTVGEGPGIDLKNGPLYVEEDREELNMIFHFDHMFIDAGPGGKYDLVDFDFVRFKQVFGQWDEALQNGGWGSVFLGNHDFSRMVSRFGNDTSFRVESAKLLATLLLTLRGTVYIYQGDEIGMTNVAFDSIEDYNDVETRNNWKEAKAKGKNMNDFLKIVHLQSRDNARTPMQWNKGKNAGFTEAEPWLKVNPNYEEINVEDAMSDEHSILSFYKEMIKFRKDNLTLVYGNYECLDLQNKKVFAYRRFDGLSEFLILLNFSDEPVQWHYDLDQNAYETVKSNQVIGDIDFELKPWQAKILRKK